MSAMIHEEASAKAPEKDKKHTPSAAARFQDGFSRAETETFVAVWVRFVEALRAMIMQGQVQEEGAMALGLAEATEWVEALVRARRSCSNDDGHGGDHSSCRHGGTPPAS